MNKIITGAFGAMLGLSFNMAHAAAPELQKAIDSGKSLFSSEKFGGNGNTCETCHVAGGTVPGKLPNGKAIPSLTNAAAIFPRFNPKAGKVVTLEDQVRGCIGGGIQGTPPALGAEQLTNIVAYITSLSQGKALDMGGKAK